MTMTIQKCLHICRRKGFQFSGLQWQIECYCGNLPTDGFEWAWPEKCDERCAGDSNQMCGGSMAMNLYNTPRNILCGLCVYDDPEKRVFGGPSIIGQNDMTIEKCNHFCSNYKFFGVEAGDECHCGDSDNTFLSSPEIQCDTACKGNVSQICGGSWRMNVFKTFKGFDLVFDSSIPAISEEIIPDVIRYSDTTDIFMLLEYYAYYKEYEIYYNDTDYWFYNNDDWYYYGPDDYNVTDHWYFMHIKSNYAFAFEFHATTSIYDTNSTMITVPEEAFLAIQKMTTTKATPTTKDLMNATMPTETTEKPTTLEPVPVRPVIICSSTLCEVTEWISKDKPTGSGDHERFK